MGKFSGYLICTDFDGTFATKGQPVAENLEAVRYFTENGGRFTVATGRLAAFLRERNVHTLINAPACLSNGSALYDYSRDTLLYERRLEMTVSEFLEHIGNARSLIRYLYVYPDIHGDAICYEDLNAISREHLHMRHLKLMCKFEEKEQAAQFKAFTLSHPGFQNCVITRSWHFGVEFNAPDATKGHALDYIRHYLGDIHTTIGVGDFENDAHLLAHADIAAAPASGLQEIQDRADMILAPCAEGAIRDLIEKLEKRI